MAAPSFKQWMMYMTDVEDEDSNAGVGNPTFQFISVAISASNEAFLRTHEDYVPGVSQLDDTHGPVILLNVFTMEARDAEAFLKAWPAESAFFSQQPGHISTQLHQGAGGSTMYVNYAVFETAGALAAAFRKPEFGETAKAYPASVVALPHLVRKIAVPGYYAA